MKISREEFEKLVEEAFEKLPQYFKERLKNITIVVEDYPQFEELPDRFSLLGLYMGVPYPKRGIFYTNVLPDIITIYQKPIEAHAENITLLKKLI